MTDTHMYHITYVMTQVVTGFFDKKPQYTRSRTGGKRIIAPDHETAIRRLVEGIQRRKGKDTTVEIKGMQIYNRASGEWLRIPINEPE